jgi:hypothetical protein
MQWRRCRGRKGGGDDAASERKGGGAGGGLGTVRALIVQRVIFLFFPLVVRVLGRRVGRSGWKPEGEWRLVVRSIDSYGWLRFHFLAKFALL